MGSAIIYGVLWGQQSLMGRYGVCGVPLGSVGAVGHLWLLWGTYGVCGVPLGSVGAVGRLWGLCALPSMSAM